MRAILLILLLSASAYAQSIDRMVDRAVTATTDPDERRNLMEGLMTLEGGDAALARRALDPLRDSEVVNAAVKVLLQFDKAGPYVAQICNLIQSAEHRDKVAQRVLEYVQRNPAKGITLVGKLGDLAVAKGGDLDLRDAAVQLLGRIPAREAVAVIARVWKTTDQLALRARCELEIGDLLNAKDGDEAVEALKAHIYSTYYDLAKLARSRMKTRVNKLEESLKKARELAFVRATPEEVFATFVGSDEEAKPYAAARAGTLAAAKKYGKKGLAYFTAQVVDCLLKELAKGTSKTAESLLGTLQTLYATEALVKNKLPRAPELRDALRALAAGNADHAKFAMVAIGLLGGMGSDSVDAIGDFASRHGNTDVRKEAVKALGELASAGDPKLKARVGELLAALLKSDPPRAVLSRILFSLRSAPSSVPIKSIEKIVFPEDPRNALDRGDLVYCIELLAQSPSPEALPVLERLAEESADVSLRITAVKEGLLDRTLGGKDSSAVLSFLARLVRDAKQPEEVRLGVLTALGAGGGRTAASLLGELAGDAKLDAKLRTTAARERLALATRLLQRGENLSDEDLRAVARILSEESARNGTDPARLLTIARSAVQAADRRGVKAGGCRELYAVLLGKQKNAKPAKVRAAWKNAAENAGADGLAPNDQIRVLTRYRGLLLPTGPGAKPASRPDREEGARMSLRLRDVAQQNGKVSDSIRYWLDAFDVAVKLGDRKFATNVKAGQPTGDLKGDQATRWEKLSKAYDALK